MSGDKRVRIVCDECGETDVMRDAWAVWDEEGQNWELGETFDDAYCRTCDAEVSYHREVIGETDASTDALDATSEHVGAAS